MAIQVRRERRFTFFVRWWWWSTLWLGGSVCTQISRFNFTPKFQSPLSPSVSLSLFLSSASVSVSDSVECKQHIRKNYIRCVFSFFNHVHQFSCWGVFFLILFFYFMNLISLCAHNDFLILCNEFQHFHCVCSGFSSTKQKDSSFQRYFWFDCLANKKRN